MVETLLDFFAFPGRYATVKREPRILFDGATQVLGLAAGRSPEGWPEDLAIDEHLRQAARFFVRAVMLRPTADYYTLMGVSPGFQAGTLRDHYRLLMRMTHPDFATENDAWPSDAATRINQANDVLSSVVRRAEYDQSMPSPTQVVSVSQARSAPTPQSRTVSVQDEPPRRRHWPVVAGVVGALALLVIWQWPSDSSRDSLIKLSDESPVDSMQLRKAAPVFAEDPSAYGGGVARHPGVRAGSETPLAALAPAPSGWASWKPASPSNLGEALAKERGAVTLRDDKAQSALSKSSLPGSASSDMSSPMDVPPHSQKLVAPMPATVAVTTATPAPPNDALRSPASLSSAAVAATALSLPSVSVPTEPSAGATRPENLRMADVQPVLGQLLSAFASGRGDQISRLVDRSAKQGDGGARFVELYNRTVSGARGVRVGAVQFADRGVGEQLAVDGVVLLQILDDGARPQTRELVVRAWFSSRDGQPVLTQLTTGESAR